MAKGFLDGYKTYDTTGGFGDPDKWRNAFNERMTEDEARRVLINAEKSPYEILGVPPTAAIAAIKKAFRILINEWHPDKNQHRISEAEEISKRLIAAYSLLTNP
ncbi:J domain-containing protein [Paraflavitalea pollutisoli]|uniref:J domain-containing protein n=1 Tax=Paraflavitalea pollutisoli TaxID=3034143 RepID=UPI0023ECC1C7|nr:J domain-containing protein [Paraflavitalea sp. H1-2-19X]